VSAASVPPAIGLRGGEKGTEVLRASDYFSEQGSGISGGQLRWIFEGGGPEGGQQLSPEDSHRFGNAQMTNPSVSFLCIIL